MTSPDYVAVSRHLERMLGVPPGIRVNGKAPLDSGWPTGPRRKPNEWRRRLEGHSGNLGMLTGNGLVVIDVDLYHEGAVDSIEALHDLGLPRETVTGITGGGGRHLVYRTKAAIPSRALAGYPGVDIKGEGGQVVVPPSVHPDTGRSYEWEHSWGPGDVEPAELPEGIVDLLTEPEWAPRDLDERDEATTNLLLEQYHAHNPRQRGGWIEVTRPGKDDGCSATIGKLGPGVAKVWSTHWDGLPAGVYHLSQLRKFAGVPQPKLHVPGIELPPGVRLWRLGDELRPPTLGTDAYHGPIGDYLTFIDGSTEAHPAAIGFSVLTYLGCWLGRGVTYTAGEVIRHHPALWGAFVGPTSSGAKGISWSAAKLLLDSLDPKIVTGHSASGFGSGEALVAMLRDDDEHPSKSYVVHDHELASVLRVAQREGSTLSELLRKAFDGESLENRTRQHGELIATRYFLAALASITATELRQLLDAVSIENGLGNRMLWLWSELTTLLPFGARIDPVRVAAIGDRIADGIAAVLEAEYPIVAGSAAGDVWAEFYNRRRRGVGKGPVEALTSRHHVHAARLATVYAAIDGAPAIDLAHVRAGIAWCDYSLATVELIFGEIAGDAAKLLTAIRDAGTDGLDGTAQYDVFQRHRSRVELDEIRTELERRQLIHTAEVPTAGRTRRVSFAVTPIERNPDAR